MWRALAAGLLLCLLATACGGQGTDDLAAAPAVPAAAAEPRPGGVITVGLVGEPTTFIDWNARSLADLEAADLVFRRLARPGAEPGTFEPDLATAWEVDHRERSIVFQLREDVSWEDGPPVTATDVLFTEQRAADPRSAFSSYKRQIAAVTAEGPDRVRFSFRRAYPEMLAHAVMGHVYPAHLLQAVAPGDLPDHPFNRKPVGNGRFVLEQWAGGRYLWFAARRDPSGAPGPLTDRVHLRLFRAYDEAFRQMETGAVGLLSVPAELVDRVRAIPSFTVLSMQTRGVYYLVWNTRREPFDRSETRRALAGLIDRRALATEFAGLADAVALGPVPPGHPWYRPTDTQLLPGPDEASGWLDRDESTIRLLSLASDAHAAIARSIADQWRAAGIAVEHVEVDRAAYTKATKDGAFDVVLQARSKTSDLHLPDAFGTSGGSNVGGFHDDELQAMLDDLSTDLEFERQRARFQAAVVRIAELEPWTFLIYRSEHLAVHEKLRGVDENPGGLFAWADRWWTAH